MNLVVQSLNAENTHFLGVKLGKLLQGGDVICLMGDLGAGKTALAKGIGSALAIQEPMTSPTFTFQNEYAGVAHSQPIRLIHMDLYRLRYPEEVEIIGVEDAFQEDAICLIEWPEIAADILPKDCLEIRIEGSGEEPRNISFRSNTDDWERRLKEFEEVS
ncbi:ATPase, YjeE family [Desulfitobacterium dichloroeliminans LMG P-21439]|uniref:tRNA threonylcarbamoyladenosine biosynthesis protein TsaE n=1 Tax=Desulfitobacterium dichloroeliminans (strain LMG P-21439 / DCA1) TaxID=871963 RepID=L0F6V5_DESDL|nr:tRNA (adenosine(37)-N6)-threonylcarbamoyltransferase complex ATPase subunit type 1 TsaE [Desulfitobacterium dichloroeliminans]AGA68688.1 ATPase, YjeE family [Desulfitobacterium dichloroeliminans LMG P-21439]